MTKGLGSANPRAGQLVWGSWTPISGVPGSEVAVAIVQGVEDGPTLWIQASLHGNEFDATIAVQRFIRAIEPKELRGTVIALPVANAAAHKAASRITPSDGKDPNRQFPGRANGSESERLAFALSSAIAARASTFIDVHSSTETFLGIDHAIYMAGSGEVASTAADLARASELAVVWESTGGWLEGASYNWAAKQGIPSVLVDVGLLTDVGAIDARVAGLVNILARLGMVRADSPRPPVLQFVVRDPEWVIASSEGLIVDAQPIGAVINHGTPVFSTVDRTGEVIQTARCPEDHGLVITTRRIRRVAAGMEVISIGRILASPEATPV
jgi:predicted deacylase